MYNPDIRNKFTMSEKQTGVLINKIYPESSAHGLLEPEDVILSVNSFDVGNDGTIESRAGSL